MRSERNSRHRHVGAVTPPRRMQSGSISISRCMPRTITGTKARCFRSVRLLQLRIGWMPDVHRDWQHSTSRAKKHYATLDAESTSDNVVGQTSGFEQSRQRGRLRKTAPCCPEEQEGLGRLQHRARDSNRTLDVECGESTSPHVQFGKALQTYPSGDLAIATHRCASSSTRSIAFVSNNAAPWMRPRQWTVSFATACPR